jgi:glycosyltransferase involved in cell wall biosynthesis
MIICHIAPFAPNRCGLYEMARDMARADIEGGNQVIFLDVGVTTNGVRENPIINGTDDRAGFKLTTASAEMIEQADIIIAHTGIPDAWLIRNQIPIIWAVHGRPLACFRPEIMEKGSSYSWYIELSKWNRSKKMLYFWPEFEPYWSPFFNNKDLILDPIFDENRFNSNGEVHKLKNIGIYNILVCDSEREDIDLYEMCIGLLHSCNQIPGLKVHFFGLNFPLKKPWEILLKKLDEVGGLGDISGRIGEMEKIYRAVDCLISPNRIVTRTIGEALCCGIPVINEIGCKYSDYQCNMADTKNVVETVKQFVSDFNNKKIDKHLILERSKVFNMINYYTKMNEIYKEVLS